MIRDKILYFITATTALFGLLMTGYFIIQTGRPSADVLAKYEETQHLIRISDYEPGEPRLVVINNAPIIVWRRDAEEIKLAKLQDLKVLWPVPLSYPTSKHSFQIASDADLTIDHEWFFALARIPNSMGCVMHSKAGDFHGFFDPCRGNHFDLAGRWRKGSSPNNLWFVPAQKTEDGKFIKLTLDHLPNLKR
jgi:ubiquinol-cytochrome c reductase iron-sulfur subunit